MQKLFQKAKLFLGKQPLFLLLLPLFFIYSGYNELFGFLSIRFILSNLAVILGCIAICLLLFYKLFHDFTKASIFTFILSLFCLVFGYLHDSLKQFFPQSFFIKFTFLIPAIFCLFLIAYVALKKRKKTFGELYVFLNLLFLVLLLSEIPNSVKRYQLDKSVDNLIDFRFNAFNEYKPEKALPDSLKPDIYFLLFDAMASSKSILQNFGRNNYQLDTFLKQKGFYVIPKGKANYNWTIHSLSTTFNMEYLPPWIAPVMNDGKAYFWGSASILNNSLFRILKQEGYTIKSYQPISFDNKDWPGDSYFSSFKKYHYSFKTLPGRIYRDVFWNYNRIDVDFIKERQFKIISNRNNEKKAYLDTTMALIKQSCSTSGKQKFIYGHFMIPHDPYTFDSTGKVKKPEQTIIKRKEDDADAYYSQLVYAGTVIKELVAYIQKNNKKNTIIIVAGDHGYRSSESEKAGYNFENFNAFYFPDKDYAKLYDSISPVNTFRIVLNKSFGSNLPILKDSSILVTVQKETIRKKEKIDSN